MLSRGLAGMEDGFAKGSQESSENHSGSQEATGCFLCIESH